MNKIEWSNKLSVDINLLDEQNKILMRMLYQLAEAHNTSVRVEIVSETLTKMTEYARTHFKSEERLMIEHGYPGYKSHKEQHKEFIKKTVSFCNAASLKVDTVPKDMLEYLRDWYVRHITQEDMKYEQFFKERGLLGQI